MVDNYGMEKKTNILLIKKKKSKSVRTEDYHFVWRCDAGHIVRTLPYGMTGRKEIYIDDIEIYASTVSRRNRRSTRETPYVSEKEQFMRYLNDVHEMRRPSSSAKESSYSFVKNC